MMSEGGKAPIDSVTHQEDLQVRPLCGTEHINCNSCMFVSIHPILFGMNTCKQNGCHAL